MDARPETIKLLEESIGRTLDDINQSKIFYDPPSRVMEIKVKMHETGAQGWCTEMTQRDGMGREVGGSFRMGNTCTPVADSYQCMAKPLQ